MQCLACTVFFSIQVHVNNFDMSYLFVTASVMSLAKTISQQASVTLVTNFTCTVYNVHTLSHVDIQGTQIDCM